ncbi:VOC family protein [Methanobrevibacter sp. OttesenSCG-928-K11]|nr:VOC family protein [Methanobrevibacter sp. OttesenSCG-928-K11]MDL2270273.1 VOC family protein [Methanobrevibacter sp. OttesenSCG-928-I08]
MKIKYNTMIIKDMEESVKFYTEVLDFEIDSEYDLPQAKITLIKGEGDSMIELIQDKVNDIGLYSVGIDVEDIDNEVEKLKSKGVKFILEPTKISVGTMALLHDPNGINIVLVQHD